MTQFTVYFDGTLTTVSPFATCPPDNKGRNNELLLPRIPVNRGGALEDTPFIPASTLKGPIRRAAARAPRYTVQPS